MGLMAGLDLLDAHKNFPSIVVVRPSLLSLAVKRWPWAQVIDVSAKVDA
jgi:hypothetical protein